MVLRENLNFTAVSTALLLSIIALPVSLVAFAVLYANNDSFWPALWMVCALPIIWVAAAILAIRDTVKRRSWRQAVGVLVLLVLKALLVNTMASPRFRFHQLFTFRPLDLHIPINGFAFIQKFQVCARESACTSRGPVTETKTFRLAKVPDGCCSLRVVNGRGGKHKVATFSVFLNGKEVDLPSGDLLQISTVAVGNDNEVSVRLSGTPDAYIYVLISFTGKKESPHA